MGNHGHQLFDHHGPCGRHLEHPDQSGRNPVRRYPDEPSRPSQCAVVYRLSRLEHRLVFCLQSGVHHPGMAFRQTGAPGRRFCTDGSGTCSGLCFLEGSLALGISPSFSFAAVGSSMILWSLVYSWHLQFWGITRYNVFQKGPFRICRPVHHHHALDCDAENRPRPRGKSAGRGRASRRRQYLIIYVNLCIVGPALIAHNAFWLRWPLTLPAPPGTPPPEQAVLIIRLRPSSDCCRGLSRFRNQQIHTHPF